MRNITAPFYELIDRIIAEDLELIASIAVILVALVLGWLLLRGPRLWYWKVNQKAGTLTKIDSRLKQVEKYLVKEEAVAVAVSAQAQDVCDLEIKQPVEKKQEPEVFMEDKIKTFMGKSGRIYREDELEAQIKD